MNRVFIVVSELMNNFGIVPQGTIIGKKQVFFHNDPQVSIVDGTPSFNFDYMVSDGLMTINGHDAESIVSSKRLFINRRYNKLQQAIRLNNYAQEYHELPGFMSFVPVRSWAHRQTGGYTNLVHPQDKYVIKPNDGARGIGQILIDPVKIPFVVVVDALDRYVSARYTKEQFFEQLHKYDPSIKLTTAGENREDEGIKSLSNQGWIVQSFIDNVKAEYRLITDYKSDIAYCQKRAIRKVDDTFPQATGSDTNSIAGDDVLSIDTVLTSKRLAALQAMVKAVIGPLSSIDLFTTSNGGWGIFEYCNQFGIKGIPQEVTMKLHVDFLNDLIDGAAQ